MACLRGRSLGIFNATSHGGMTARAFLLVLMVLSKNVGAQAVGVCADPNKEFAQTALESLRRVLASSSADDSAWRSLARLPLTPANEVTLLTSEEICEKAAATWWARADTTREYRNPVWVYRIGDERYIVFDGGRNRRRRVIMSILDRQFCWLEDAFF